ncbi:hypothetical protein F4819DRAFT_444509 [Hypoxylon fuscum]|nr:hypothetical protein F4819DRAFT_444509 [Hypoxylon fuscum]
MAIKLGNWSSVSCQQWTGLSSSQHCLPHLQLASITVQSRRLMMVAIKHIVQILLGLIVPTVWAGNCNSCIQDPDGSQDVPDPGPWRECKNPVPHLGWHCSDKALDFPTVDCLIADMKACGNLGAGPTIFYSMGATTVQVREGFRDKLNPKGVMFNDALGQKYWDTVIYARPEFGINENQARQAFFRDIFAIAMAKASQGEVFLVTATRKGDANPPGDPGIFQNPLTLPNIWRQMELPNLQRNPAITKITNVVVEENFKRTTDWKHGDGKIFPLDPIDVHHPPLSINNELR